jgi:type II secretory pathway pseudopilin PulG
MNKKHQQLNQMGFTFIELILYVMMISGILATLIPFSWNIIEGQAKVSVEQEVYTQARYLSERIKKEVRDASGVNTCSASTISLANLDSTKNPTVFTFGSNQITITQGTAIPVAVRLHSIDTAINTFSCTNYTASGSKNIQFNFTMTDNSPSTRQEYQESVSIQSSAETRE